MSYDGRRAERRLPKHRPPTHPGEMLLEEFLKPLGIRVREARRLQEARKPGV